MVDRTIESIIQGYAHAAWQAGIPISEMYLFGSHARGESHPESDIDLIVVVDDTAREDALRVEGELWKLRAKTDSRIEPLLVFPEEWEGGEARV